MKKKELIIIICVILFSFSGLVLRNFPFSQGNFDKAMPPVITSYDVFANTEHIKWIYNSEQAYYYSLARTGGISEVIGTHPTLYYIFIATFTKLTTITPYQTAYLAVNLLSIIVILQIFLLVRKLFGDETALIGLALGAIPAYKWLFPMYVGFQYDYYTFAVIPAIIYLLILRFETQLSTYQKFVSYSILGLFFTEQFLGHYVELFFYAPFFAVIPVLFIFWKKTIKFKEYFFALIIITLIISPYIIHFIPLTLKDHLRGGISGIASQFSAETSKHMDYFPWPRFDFWLNIFSIAGIIFFIININKNITAGRTTYSLFLLYLLFVGFSNYTLNTWSNRAERQLFQGYPFLVLFPALGITAILKLLKTTQLQKLGTLPLIGILLFIPYNTFTDSFNAMKSIDQASFVDDAKWQSIEWIRDNTPKESRVFALSGFEHEFTMLTERVNLKGDLNRGYTIDNIKALCAGKYPDNYLGEWAFREYGVYGVGTYFKKRTSINTFENMVDPFQNESEGYVFKGPDRGNQSVPLKFFDYVLLQYRGTGFDPCMAYFLNESMNRGHTIDWYNNEMAIVKVNKEAKEKQNDKNK